MYLALGDMAASRLDDVFDGVFQRDDVVMPVQIDFLHHCRQRRGFSAADRAGHEDEAVVIFGQLFEALR